MECKLSVGVHPDTKVALDYLTDNHSGRTALRYIVNEGTHIAEANNIRKESPETLVLAVVNGYHAKAEPGDWVIADGYSTRYNNKPLLITKVAVESYGVYYYFSNHDENRETSHPNFDANHYVRHATKAEIYREIMKDDVIWGDNGREWWELLPGDLLKNRIGNIREVSKINKYGEYVLLPNYTPFSKDELNENFTMVCFVENREDKKDD